MSGEETMTKTFTIIGVLDHPAFHPVLLNPPPPSPPAPPARTCILNVTTSTREQWELQWQFHAGMGIVAMLR